MKTILFDFDGTIADTLEAVLRIGNQLAPEFGYQPATADQIKQFRSLHSREIIGKSQIALWKLPFILRRILQELNQEVEQLSLVPQMQETILELTDLNYSLAIVTTNSQANVRLFLEIHNLLEYFDFIHADTRIFGKARALGRVIKHQRLHRQQVIYVGDEIRDIEAARKNQISVIAVGWGFNTPEALLAYQPDFLVDHPPELVEVLGQL